ncbi:hypothetical protein [Flagellimonas sp. S3867]|uniref:hypothetical protein n=1 Tax=Flagellimonas sp. S3867 TaxID=2768063 RepID=UPI0016831510|nr:hypothetical protein [Flagellimonas sp. S3867]
MEAVITVFLTILGIYFSLGLLFGLYFIFLGATKVDPFMTDSKKKVRLLLFPGVVATWPFLVGKLIKPKTLN